MSLSSDFYEYARMSEFQKLYIPHSCVIVVQEQEGQPTDATGYIPMDLTTGICQPSIVDIREPDLDLDVPGMINGRDLIFDNSLTLPGDGTNYRSVPLTVTVTADDAVRGVNADTDVDYANVKVADRSQTYSFVAELIPAAENLTLLENLQNLVAVPGTFSYNDGSGWTSMTGTRRWDGATVFEGEGTFPATATGELTLRANLDSDAIVGSYEWKVTLYTTDSVTSVTTELGNGEDTFAVS